MWGELGGGRGNLVIPMATYNPPPILRLGTHSGTIAGGNALQLCGLFNVGRSTLAGIAMDSVDPAYLLGVGPLLFILVSRTTQQHALVFVFL